MKCDAKNMKYNEKCYKFPAYIDFYSKFQKSWGNAFAISAIKLQFLKFYSIFADFYSRRPRQSWHRRWSSAKRSPQGGPRGKVASAGQSCSFRAKFQRAQIKAGLPEETEGYRTAEVPPPQGDAQSFPLKPV